MKLFKKAYWVIFPIILFICLLILDKGLDVENFFIRSLISGFVAYILSPRKKIVNTKTGEIKQINWIFLKKPIIID